MFGAGKCSLLNIDNQTIIPSISTWKIKYSTNNTKMVVHDMLLLDEDDLDAYGDSESYEDQGFEENWN